MIQILLLLLPILVQSGTVIYTIPSTAPSTATALDPAPLGISFEFFAFPSYFLNVTGTNQCLKNFEELTGTWPPIRIGGTTQDRATYDASSSAYVTYSVASPLDAPASLTFGPSFMDLAATYQGTVVIGLNRGHDNITNTIAAAKVANDRINNLLAIELGNEPEYYTSDDQPIAINAGTWDPATDAASQDDWDILVGSALDQTLIIQAGNSNAAPPTWGAAELIATENATARSYVHDYAHHNYPGGTLTSLMSHSNIVSDLAIFTPEVAAAATTGKEYVLGETNSVSGGGAATVSPLFGASLWTMDYMLQATVFGIKRVYYHHGTVGECFYCFWGRYDMGAPYYGAYAAAAAVAGASSIVSLDTGNSSVGGYAVFDGNGSPLRVLLLNSVFYDGSGVRGNQSFVLEGLSGEGVRAKRLTAPSANSRVDQGGNPSFGGQMFANETCVVEGEEVWESSDVVDGQATLVVGASEALLVYL
ncbi:glycoside hydrolase family 79 protein [Hyaloscypha variabilis F]|uniref:Glycoside hydrolase family 79 protein n=1 Tax=Hyaloscypha variabilis (strain UAMH 11265 / GT02V1 / F) TaxID=1149755 RepID=A0A2J6QRQ5_HYAVF|nr:glycoside hydrolase family 79 protein [Hyaloscypha variabilis F]